MKRRERDSRLLKALELRDGGGTFRQIADALGLSNTRAQQLCRLAEQKRKAHALQVGGPESFGSLEVRTATVLRRFGCYTREDVRILCDQFPPCPGDIPGMGRKTIDEVLRWLNTNQKVSR